MSKTEANLPHKKVGVAVIRNQKGEILIARRLATGLMGGLWEFPGGKIEPNETVQQCIKREILEEIGIEIQVEEELITINHQYPQFYVTLIVHYCSYLKGEPQPLECQEVRWVTLAEIANFSFPSANSQIIQALHE